MNEMKIVCQQSADKRHKYIYIYIYHMGISLTML